MAEVTAQAESFLQELEAQAQQAASAPSEVPGLGPSSEDAVASAPLDPAAAAMQLAAQQAAERFNQQFAAQQAQQPLTPDPAEPSQPSAPAANGSADYAAQPFQTFEQNGTQAASLPPVPVLVAATPADGAGGGRKRRNRWGPKEGEAPAAGQEQAPDASEGGVTPPPAEEPGKKKRRSRWEEPAPEPSMALANVGAGAFPKELVLPGGIKVAFALSC